MEPRPRYRSKSEADVIEAKKGKQKPLPSNVSLVSDTIEIKKDRQQNMLSRYFELSTEITEAKESVKELVDERKALALDIEFIHNEIVDDAIFVQKKLGDQEDELKGGASGKNPNEKSLE